MPAPTMPATVPELRHAVAPIHGLEVRAGQDTGDGSITIKGHAAVFDQETILYDVGWWRMREKIEPGAFGEVLSRNPLVHLVHQHDMRTAMAATDVEGIGGLELSEDDQGLYFFARTDPEDRDVAALEVKMRRRVVRQASFAFTVARAKYEVEIDDQGNEDELRTIQEIGELYDVSVVAQGAYPQADSELARQMRAFMSTGRPPMEGAASRVAPEFSAGADPVAPVPPAGGDQRARQRRLAAMRANARSRLTIATLTIRR